MQTAHHSKGPPWSNDPFVSLWLNSQLSFVYGNGLFGFCLLSFLLNPALKPHLCAQWRSANTCFKVASFCVPDEHGSGPGDVGTPSTLQHKKAEALGRFEATVEAVGSVWDRSAARVLCTDLHDKGRIGGSHAKHRWQCTNSEYCSAIWEGAIIWTNLSVIVTYGQSGLFATSGATW